MLEEFLCFLGSRTRVQWQWKHRVPCLKSDPDSPVSQLDISTMPWRQDFKSRSLGIFLATMESCTSRWHSALLWQPHWHPCRYCCIWALPASSTFQCVWSCLQMCFQIFSNPVQSIKTLTYPHPTSPIRLLTWSGSIVSAVNAGTLCHVSRLSSLEFGDAVLEYATTKCLRA